MPQAEQGYYFPELCDSNIQIVKLCVLHFFLILLGKSNRFLWAGIVNVSFEYFIPPLSPNLKINSSEYLQNIMVPKPCQLWLMEKLVLV